MTRSKSIQLSDGPIIILTSVFIKIYWSHIEHTPEIEHSIQTFKHNNNNKNMLATNNCIVVFQ